MIFAANGHPIDQKHIVERLFGALVCASAQRTLQVAAVLSSAWRDDNNQQFQSKIVAAYDPENGITAINNAIIVNELNQNRPLLYGNTHHAMVIVEADYYARPMGPNLQRVDVLDPWPYNPAFHPLSPAEMVPVQMGGQMLFLAAVRVF